MKHWVNFLFCFQEEKLEEQNRISLEVKLLPVDSTSDENQILQVRPFNFEDDVIIMHNVF